MTRGWGGSGRPSTGQEAQTAFAAVIAWWPWRSASNSSGWPRQAAPCRSGMPWASVSSSSDTTGALCAGTGLRGRGMYPNAYPGRNYLADVERSVEHIQGDEFGARRRVSLHGTLHRTR